MTLQLGWFNLERFFAQPNEHLAMTSFLVVGPRLLQMLFGRWR